jgi:hypothetical protein
MVDYAYILLYRTLTCGGYILSYSKSRPNLYYATETVHITIVQ